MTGTPPQHMSPEQATGNDVDTRTGSPTRPGSDAVRAADREHADRSPSLGGSGSAPRCSVRSVARSRRARARGGQRSRRRRRRRPRARPRRHDARSSSRARLSGDLDWIVMKATARTASGATARRSRWRRTSSGTARTEPVLAGRRRRAYRRAEVRAAAPAGRGAWRRPRVVVLAGFAWRRAAARGAADRGR